MFGIDDAIIGAVGGSLISGLMNNSAASSRQSDAQEFSAEQYATRYQTTVKDMQAAGLNPALAYGGISGSTPTSSAASSAGVPDLGSSAMAARMNSAQVANIAADTENKKAQADLIEAQAMQARASAWQSNSQSEVNQMFVKEITSKLENRHYENDAERVKAIALELKSQNDLNIQRGMTEQQSRALMLQQAYKLDAETDLLKLDKEAADKFNNMGRNMGQAKPFFDILNSVIRAGKGK